MSSVTRKALRLKACRLVSKKGNRQPLLCLNSISPEEFRQWSKNTTCLFRRPISIADSANAEVVVHEIGQHRRLIGLMGCIA